MEQLNFINLRGYVGNVRLASLEDGRSVCHFSIATGILYRNQENLLTEETTWHNCTLWSSKKFSNLSCIKVGMPIEVKGRMRAGRYTGSDGIDRTSYEVIVNEMVPLPADESLKVASAV